MFSITVTVLTPKGPGAIATIRVAGDGAWELVRGIFKPNKVTPSEDGQFAFGKFGDDEVILAFMSSKPQAAEVHCHGGHRVVRMLVKLLTDAGAVEAHPVRSPLASATTQRTASILLDQIAGGAFRNSVGLIREELTRNRGLTSPARLKRLYDLCSVGRHLTRPWNIAIVGPPNVGKSTLLNALAGYQRSIVAPIPGTTRDVVTVDTAFDGWPVRLSDTAGIHESNDEIESQGIERALRSAETADLVLIIHDLTGEPTSLAIGDLVNDKTIRVFNKCDLELKKQGSDAPRSPTLVSATTGQGIPELIATIVARFVPHEPGPGEAVPFTPEIADCVEKAFWDFCSSRTDSAIVWLEQSLVMANNHSTFVA